MIKNTTISQLYACTTQLIMALKRNKWKHTHTHIYTKQSHLKFTLTNFKWPGSSAWQSYNFCLGYSFSHTSLQVHFMFLPPQDINTSPSSLPAAALPSIFSVKQEAISITTSIRFHLPYLPSCDFSEDELTDCSCLKSMPPLGYQIPNPSALAFLIFTSVSPPTFPSLLDHLYRQCINTFLLLPFLGLIEV